MQNIFVFEKKDKEAIIEQGQKRQEIKSKRQLHVVHSKLESEKILLLREFKKRSPGHNRDIKHDVTSNGKRQK